MLNKTVGVYKNLSASYMINDINKALELYIINMNVQDNTLLIYLGEDKEEWLGERNKIANSCLGKYSNQHSDILADYKDVDVT